MRRRALAVALMLTLPLGTTFTASPIFAADEDRAVALDLFEQGRALFKSGSYAAALTQFEAARKLMRTFGILLNIAECQEKLGRTASAWTTWREARAVASESQRVDDERMASERQKVLEASLSRLTVIVPPGSDIPDLEIRRDGTVLPREGWGRPIAVDPGSHVIEASAPGRKSRTLRMSVQANGDSRSFSVSPLEADPEARPPPVASPATLAAPPPPTTALPANPRQPLGDDGSTGSGQRLAGWIVGGLGMAAVGTGIAFAIVGQGQHNDAVATDLAGNVPQAQTMESNANTTKTLGYITLAGGGAFVLTGLVLVLSAPTFRSTPISASPSATFFVRPWVSAAGGGALLSQEW